MVMMGRGVKSCSRCDKCGEMQKTTDLKKVWSKYYFGLSSLRGEGLDIASEPKASSYCRTCYRIWLRAIEELIE